MKQKVLYRITFPVVILLASLSFGACSSDDDSSSNNTGAINENKNVTDSDRVAPPLQTYTVEQVAEEPTWRVDWQYNQERPDWQMPSSSDFEHWTVITLDVEEELMDMTGRGDMLAVFIDDELCGLSAPAVTLGGGEEEDDEENVTYKYLMKVYAHSSDDGSRYVTLKYYNDSLKQVFTSWGEISFGIYEDMTELYPQFTLGSEKYPLNMTLSIELTASEASGVEPMAGDRLAAFVGDECRGVYTIGEYPSEEPIWVQVNIQQPDELVTLRYYNAATQRVFTFTNTFSMVDDMQIISINL